MFDNEEDFVPLETTPETSIGGGHWSETELGNEIMTPNLTDGYIISEVTIGAMADLGYEVDLSEADLELPTPQAEESESSSIWVEDDVVAAATFDPDTAGDNNNYFTGASDDDLLVGSKGDDFVTGGEGKDTFFVELGRGSDVITDFASGKDYIGLDNGLGLSDLNIVQSDNTLIQDSQNNILAILQGVEASSISTDDFVNF